MEPGDRTLTHRRLLCGAAMAVALVIYLGTVGSGFVWDDEVLIRSWLPYFDGPRAVLWPPPGIPHFIYQYYRPVLIASWVVDEQLARSLFPSDMLEQGRRIVFHLTPVLLHVVCTGAVFLLGLMLLGERRGKTDNAAWVAFAGALVFATHPVHVETVAWIVGRSDSLCTLASLASLMAFLDWRRRRRWISLAVAPLLFLLGACSKEMAFGTLLPLVLVGLWPTEERKHEPMRLRLMEIGAFLGAIVVYVGLRATSVAQVRATMAPSGSLGRLVGALGWYAGKAVWPFPQSVFPDDQFSPASVILGWVAAAVIAVSVFVFRTSDWRAERLAMAIAVGGCALALPVAVTDVSTSPVAERNLYLPSAGGCLLAAFLADRLARRLAPTRPSAVPWVVVCAGVLAIPSGVVVSQRLPVWDNPVLFWSAACASAPNSAVAHINLGAALVAEGRYSDAESAYRDALRLAKAPDQAAMAHTNLGALFVRQARLDEAIDHFRQALANDPTDATGLLNWASALAHKADQPNMANRDMLLEEARARLTAAIALHPRYAKAHLLLGTILLSSGQGDRARAELEMVVALDPGSAEAARARALLSGEARVSRVPSP